MTGCLGSLAVNASLNGLAASGLAAAFWARQLLHRSHRTSKAAETRFQLCLDLTGSRYAYEAIDHVLSPRQQNLWVVSGSGSRPSV